MTRQTVFAAVTTFMLGLAVSHFLERPSLAQQIGGEGRQVGRFVTAVGGHSPYVAVTDTVTGESWSVSPSGSNTWTKLGPPPKAEKP